MPGESTGAWYNPGPMTQTATTTTIGPADHGRRMSLDEFDTAIGREGHLYELSRGVIVVMDVPNPPHGDPLDELRLQLFAYRARSPGVIHRVYAGSECKLLIEPTQSERHPDLAVYKTPPPGDDSRVWSTWVPEIVVEVVSADSGDRDYLEKAEDYLSFGVQEYWVIDRDRGAVVVHRRTRGKWAIRELRPGDRHATNLLPGFELNVEAVLSA